MIAKQHPAVIIAVLIVILGALHLITTNAYRLSAHWGSGGIEISPTTSR